MQDLTSSLGCSSAQALFINNLDQVVGHHYCAVGGQHAFIWSSMGGFLDLGTLETDSTLGPRSYPGGVNNLGQVVGLSTASGIWQEHAFLWSAENGMQDLGTLAGDIPNTTAMAIGINDLGQVIGWSETFTPAWEYHAFLWTPENGMQDLGVVVDYSTSGLYINNLGQIAGTRYISPTIHHAFIWTADDGVTDLGTINGSSDSESFVSGINDSGQVVGWSTSISGYNHAFIWTAENGMQDLDTLGGDSSSAVDINNLGWVVGSSQNLSGDTHAFVWTEKDGMIDMGTLGGNSAASQINNNGHSVGVSKIGGYWHATLWTLYQAPADISLSNNSVNENQVVGTAVGTISTTDPDAGDTFTYTFCGGIDDASFSITDDSLNTAEVFDYETKTSYSICIESTDSGSLSTTKAFTINVNNLVDTQTFADVADIYWAWDYIERLYNAGITGGCTTSPLNYCPENQVTRAQMAVFLEKGLHYPLAYTAPNVAPTFNDTVGHWAEDWIEALKSDGVTAGCATGLYCPENPVTRAQMAVFLLKSKYGSSYVPPDVGADTGFGDVPTTHWAAAWIKQLAAEGITGGCGGGNYCPENPVTRAQMAVFLVKTFNLP